MFIRQKRNNSKSISIQIIDKSSGKYKVLKTIGSSKDSKVIEQLIKQAFEKSEIPFNEKLDDLKASQCGIIVNKHFDALIEELKNDGFIE